LQYEQLKTEVACKTAEMDGLKQQRMFFINKNNSLRQQLNDAARKQEEANEEIAQLRALAKKNVKSRACGVVGSKEKPCLRRVMGGGPCVYHSGRNAA
jgi:hypothetical protein